MSNDTITYLTADGLLEPLGFSQVLRVVEGLAQRGWRYRVFSLERPADLANVARVREVRQRLAASGVDWRFEQYAVGGGGRAAMQNELALVDAAVAAARRGARALHARAYHGGVAALAAWTATGVPWLFDTRSYWFDERLEEGRWFTSPLRLGVARGIEHQLFACASAVVSLTELQLADVRAGRFGPSRHRALACIPTCADFEDFVRRAPDACFAVPPSLRQKLSGKRVLGVVGSINRSYLVEETMALAARVLAADSAAELLVLSGQQEEYRALALRSGLDLGRLTIVRAAHEQMPQWLSLMDWGFLLLNPASPAKRASMPTKLAEFLAVGVQPLQFGCNPEVSSWVRKSGLGLALEQLSPESLDRAVEAMLGPRPTDERRDRARRVASPHFSLEAGLSRYDDVLRACVGAP